MGIDDRLRADAARMNAEDATPPFELMLDRAVVRPSRAPWLAVAAVALIAAAVSVVAARPWQSSGHAPAGGNGPGMPRRYADYLPVSDSVSAAPPMRTVYVDDIGITAVVRDPSDPRFVTLVPVPNPQARCGIDRPKAYVERVGSSSLTVRLAGWQMLAAQQPTGPVGWTCYQPPTTEVSVMLPVSLGGRTVIDSRTGAAVPVLDRTELPEPSYLPSGYVADGTQPIDVASGRLIGERDYLDGTDRIIVMVGAVSQIQAATAPVVDHATVAGHDAAVTTQDGTCITWEIRAAVDTSVCAVGTPDATIPTSEVVAVARSLP